MNATPKSLTVCKVTSLLLLGFLFLSFTTPYVNNGIKGVDVSKSSSILPASIRTIVIDAGHGGKDNGCKHNHAKEKQINLSIAKALGNLLKIQFPNLNIVFTRGDDRFVSLDERIATANNNYGDLFISIHCNYVKQRVVSGTELFVLGNTQESISEHQYLGHDIGISTNTEVGQHDYAQSMDLALAMNKAMTENSSLKNRGIKQAPFTVLKKAKMPSVLIETGFLSNPRDFRVLNSKEGQLKFASTILQGFKDYCITIKQREEIAYKPSVVNYGKLKQPLVKKTKLILPSISPRKLAYQIILLESETLPRFKNTDQWKGLGTIEVIKEAGLYKLISEKTVTLEEAISLNQSYQERGFTESKIIHCLLD